MNSYFILMAAETLDLSWLHVDFQTNVHMNIRSKILSTFDSLMNVIRNYFCLPLTLYL